MRVISPDNTGPVSPHIMYTSEIMAAIMRRDKFMQIFCFQISQMLDRSQCQIMKIFYQGNMAKSLRAKRCRDVEMMDWGGFLRFVQLLGQEMDLFDVNLNLISKVWTSRPGLSSGEEGTNKQSLKVNLAPDQFCVPPDICVSSPGLQRPTQCDISSYTQPTLIKAALTRRILSPGFWL